jgi:DNA-binding Lrp family transcriptional regulator
VKWDKNKRKTIMKPYTWQHAINDSDLPVITKAVLFSLSCYLNANGGGAFPSQETLAKKLGLTKLTVRKHLHIAEKEGWIKIVRHGYSDRRWRRCEYYPQIPNEVGNEITQLNEVGYEITHPEHEVGYEITHPEHEVGYEITHPEHEVGYLVSHDQIKEEIRSLNTTEREGDNPPLPPPLSLKNIKAKAKKTSLSDDWEIPTEWIEIAASERPDLTHEQIVTAAKSFKDRRLSDGTKSYNWLANWRGWIRLEKVEKQAVIKVNGSEKKPPKLDPAEAERRLKHYERTGEFIGTWW